MTDYNEQAKLAMERVNSEIYMASKEAKAELGKMVQQALRNVDHRYEMLVLDADYKRLVK